jgi:hypothetical protein
MKHLKPFNEDLNKHDQLFKEDLQEFCGMNLAYLIDEGVDVELIEGSVIPSNKYQSIRIKTHETKSWNDIKDHMIPFLTRLNNKYEIRDHVVKLFYFTKLSFVSHTIVKDMKDLDDNTKENNYKLFELRIYITGYKKPKKSILTKIKSFFK